MVHNWELRRLDTAWVYWTTNFKWICHWDNSIFSGGLDLKGTLVIPAEFSTDLMHTVGMACERNQSQIKVLLVPIWRLLWCEFFVKVITNYLTCWFHSTYLINHLLVITLQFTLLASWTFLILILLTGAHKCLIDILQTYWAWEK